MAKFFGYILIFVLGFGACALILRGSGMATYNAEASSQGRETISKALSRPSRSLPMAGNAPVIADAAAKVEPAVVNIDIEGSRRLRSPLDFFQGGGPAVPVRGSGSGIILSGDGYVVTNNHVVAPVAERRGEIRITLSNGKTFNRVQIIGRDPRSDLAVLKIEGATNLPAATLGDSDKLRVGDWAIAVGNPLGFNSTVTLGIVSALNRRGFSVENETLDRVIQTDAAINPGNSGGALADISGQVVGINTAIASSTGASVGIGFAIPIKQAQRIIRQLIENGEVVRPYLGVSYAPLSQVERDALPPGVTLPTGDGAVLVPDARSGRPSVVPGSPADKAGLRDYDVILEINKRRVDSVDVVKDEIQKRNVGERIPLKVLRNGRTLDMTLTLERMPQNFGQPDRQPDPDR